MTLNIVGEAPPDSTFFVPKPGAVGPWLALQDCMRDSHERSRTIINEAIAAMTAKGVPTDSRVDWRTDVDLELKKVPRAKDRAEITSVLEAALAISRDGLQPIGDYVEDRRYDGIDVRLRAVSLEDLLDMRAALASVSKAPDEPDAAREARRQRACRPFVATVLAGIRGLDVGVERPVYWEGKGAPDDLTELLSEARLLVTLFSVCKDFQELSPLLRRGYGSPRPSTSLTSSAESAPPSGGAS